MPAFFCAKSARGVKTAKVSAICQNRFYVNCKSNFRLFCQGSSSVAEKCAMLQPFVNNAIFGTLLQNTKHSVNVSNLSAKTCKYNHCLSDWIGKGQKTLKTSMAQYFKPSISLCRCVFCRKAHMTFCTKFATTYCIFASIIKAKGQ